MDRIGMPPVFDPKFQAIYVAEGLEAALRDLIDRHDLEDDEAEAVSETLRRVTATPATATGT